MVMSTVTGKDATGATKTLIAASNGSSHLAAATSINVNYDMLVFERGGGLSPQ